MPERIQQRRTKGWRKPENTVSVARPSKYGNPFRITLQGCEEATRADGKCWVVSRTDRGTVYEHFDTDADARAGAVALFRERLPFGLLGIDQDDIRIALAGKNLMCFCPLDQPCHADVLLEIANR